MKKYIQINGGYECPNGISFTSCSPAYEKMQKEIADGAAEVIDYESSLTPDQKLEASIEKLASRRKAEARSGVVVNGVNMQTDKESIAAMDQYATESMMNGLTVVHWEKADGTFHDWQIADFKKLFSEITKYVNSCFGRQSQLLDEVHAAPDPTTVDISTGWPSKTITFV